jgi:hypothetical protein
MAKYPFVVGLRTARPVERIEQWLLARCRGKWHVRLEEIAFDLSHKYLIVSFERADDRVQFRQAFAKANAAAQAAAETAAEQTAAGPTDVPAADKTAAA